MMAERIAIDNWIYDQINMGAENFVISIFQHMLDRFPTEHELKEGIAMVEGRPARIFLQAGTSKSDFLDAFIGSDQYLEGKVKKFYRQYLLREPNATEMIMHLQAMKAGSSIESLQIELLSSKEFAGIEGRIAQ